MAVTTAYEQKGNHHVVSLSGKVDLYSVTSLRKELTDYIDKGVKSLAIDMNGLSYMDSSGIALLAAIQKKVKAMGAAFALVSVPEDILNVLKVAALDKFFRIVKKIEDLG